METGRATGRGAPRRYDPGGGGRRSIQSVQTNATAITSLLRARLRAKPWKAGRGKVSAQETPCPRGRSSWSSPGGRRRSKKPHHEVQGQRDSSTAPTRVRTAATLLRVPRLLTSNQTVTRLAWHILTLPGLSHRTQRALTPDARHSGVTGVGPPCSCPTGRPRAHSAQNRTPPPATDRPRTGRGEPGGRPDGRTRRSPAPSARFDAASAPAAARPRAA